ncbi:MAG: permease-like cell division protein FtsX [Oscillospiraceae bacterium]|nr:permease-like cell division protein FtsX [Oscillospiraceae bacterium]MBR4092867.1 permease-like cell division protein FtsX [Oscillospiraceae bacterium]
MRISSMKYLVGQGVKNIWTNRIMSFASFCVLTVSLLLVGFSVLATMNINRFVSGIENRNEVIIYLDDNITDEAIAEMEGILKQTENVSSVVFYSKEQAWEDEKGKYDNADEIFAYFEESPLPDAFRIRVSDVSVMKRTVTAIDAKFAPVGYIIDIKSPDDFASILTSLKSTIAIISTAIIVALAVVSMVIISNSTRASVFARSREINIMKYVGATNTFIRIPFFVEGMLTGAVAGIVSSLATWLVYDNVIGIFQEEGELWKALGMGEFIPYDTIWLQVSLAYIVIGILFGAIGTAASTRKYLKV